MTAVMAAPTVQKAPVLGKTRSMTDTGGGGGIRGIRLARTGGGGGGDNSLQYQNCKNVQDGKKMTEAERDKAVEESNQYRYGFEARQAELGAEIAKEKCKTFLSVKATQEQKTQNANSKLQLEQAKGQRIQAATSLTQIQLQGDYLKMEGAENQNQYLGARNNIARGLYGQTLTGMALQLTESMARNQHKDEMLTLQGWNNAQIGGGGGAPLMQGSLGYSRDRLRRTW